MKFSILEITVTCPKCTMPLFVNGPLKNITCENCHNEINLSKGVWKTIISDVKWIIGISNQNEGKKTEYTSPNGLEINWLSGNMKPYCMNCKEDFSDISVKEEKQWAHTCSSCGKITTVMLPPKWIKEIDDEILLFLNTSREMLYDNKGEKNPAPILFKCLSCGSDLTVDGSDRVLKCPSCGANCYLPTKIWHQFHQPAKLSRWMVFFQ